MLTSRSLPDLSSPDPQSDNEQDDDSDDTLPPPPNGVASGVNNRLVPLPSSPTPPPSDTDYYDRADRERSTSPASFISDASFGVDRLASPSPELERYEDEDTATDPLQHLPRQFASSTDSLGYAYGREKVARPFYSLWDHLREEIIAPGTEEEDSSGAKKSERVTNFLSVPGEVEKIVLFGFIICLDCFLYTLTILPLRALTAFIQLLGTFFRRIRGGVNKRLSLSQKCDLTRAVVLCSAVAIVVRITDASRMYHSVRGQETVKLYVLFNVLEIADRLCCSFGQDLQDSLFERQTLARRFDGTQPHFRPFVLVGFNIGYVVVHTLVLFYQLVALNVAVNSHNNALLTLLLSNQFVEIKGSVFKRFEKENLFQITCADIVERFQLALFLLIIGLRNLAEVTASYSPSSLLSISTPTAATMLSTISSPLIVVLLSEMFVDGLKHAFITKFNHIRPSIYGRFLDVLCRDMAPSLTDEDDEQAGIIGRSPVVGRRLGFAPLPLACLVVRVIMQAAEMLADETSVDECALPPGFFGRRYNSTSTRGEQMSDLARALGGWAVVVLVAALVWVAVVVFKLLLSINLRAFAASRWETSHLRAEEEALAGRERAHIGESRAEKRALESEKRLLRDEKLAVPGAWFAKYGKKRQSRDSTIDSSIGGGDSPGGLSPVSDPGDSGSDRKVRFPSLDDGTPSNRGTQTPSPVVFTPRAARKKGLEEDSSLMDLSRYEMVRSRVW